MGVMGAVEWLDRVLGVKDPTTGETRGSLMAYHAVLGRLTGRRHLTPPGVELNPALMRIDVFRRVYEDTASRLVDAVVGSVPARLRGLVYRAVASTAILARDVSQVRDGVLLEWLRRVAADAGSVDDSCGAGCLLDRVRGDRGALAGLAYGLRRLTRLALVEKRVDPLDYSALVLHLAADSEVAARMLAGILLGFFDEDDVGAAMGSELSYLVLAVLVFLHDSLPEDAAEALRLMRFSPDAVVACRARQLLERQLDAEIIDREYPRPCLALAAYKGEAGLYVIGVD